MALTLPLNFSNDIQGKDTALVPYVVIGKSGSSEYLRISTNVISHPNWNETETLTTLPILLNIPSLKESIDIEKRNYKISSINIDISNFPYEGQRFSELVGDSSLINTEVRIFWTSPSTNMTIFETTPEGFDNRYFQIFNGTIRRYTHDDEKVRLVVEDRSQATLHKDLPLPDDYLTDDDVPDKYKNKPIPMVYGHVDRSPCVVNTTSINDTDSRGQMTIIADNYSSDTEAVAGGNPLLIYREVYWEVFPEATEQDFLNSGYTVQHQYEFNANNKMEFIIQSIFNDNDRLNPIVDNRAQVINRNKIEGITKFKDFGATDYYGDVVDVDKMIDGSNSTYGTVSGTLRHDVEIGDQSAGGQLSDDFGTRNVVALRATYPSLGSTDYSSKVLTLYHPKIDITANNSIGWAYSVIFHTGKYTYTIDNDETLTIDEILRIVNDAIPTKFNLIWEASGDGEIDMSSKIYDLNIETILNINKFLDSDFYANVNGRAMKEIYNDYGVLLYQETPTAPTIIKHILETELGQSDIDAPDTYDWQYAFTVDKKINSKKLIEGIASASPYIPRFDNMGNFKFDVIKLTYNSSDHTIKEEDVIDFSFKRTPIEDVVTKIEFKYKWDYARGEFSKRRALDIQDFACAGWDGDWESFSYYGLPLPEPNNDTNNTWTHLESTLVIDGVQGKYIRDDDTAEKFVCWMMSWYCNQHLIMKVKLPLKYMNLEIGDIVDFDKLLGGISPYGIDYTSQSNGVPTFQAFFPYFMVTETNKRLDYVEISCIQMHQLWAQVADNEPDTEDGNMSYD